MGEAGGVDRGSSTGSRLMQRLGEQVVVADGAMGSRLVELGVAPTECLDRLNLDRPDLVRQVHQSYREAGAELLESNTFGANRLRLEAFGLGDRVEEVNQQGAVLARESAGADGFVAGAVGPLPAVLPGAEDEAVDDDTARELYRQQMSALLEAGVDLLLLETFTELHALRLAVETARGLGDTPIAAQMMMPDGQFTPDGHDAGEVVAAMEAMNVDIVGTNCGQGVARLLRAVEAIARRTTKPISAFPNSGLPERRGGRLLYVSTPDYLADSAERMADAGVNLIGGCCGTTPADIAAIAQRVGGRRLATRSLQAPIRDVPSAAAPVRPPQALPEFLAPKPGRRVVLVELDSPKNTDYAKMIRGAGQLRDAGVDAITVGDSPLAALRVNGPMMGSVIQREVQVPVICHLAGRDRNTIGTQGLLLGADLLGIRHILALTGDPAKVGDHPDASSVYDLNSFKLIDMIRRLNDGHTMAGRELGRATAFTIGAAFNPNKRDVTPEVRRLKRKIDRGAMYVLTQAVFDVETMRRGYEAVHELGVPIFAGVFPLLSDRHAEFLHHEFPGISVCDEVRQRMKDAAPDKAAMAAEGMKIAKELIDGFADCSDGLYLIPPLNRAPVAVELLRYVRQQESATAAAL